MREQVGARAQPAQRRAEQRATVAERRPPRRRHPVDTVEQDHSRVDRSDAVDQAVMGLRAQRPPVALEALQQHELPERPRAVEAV